MSVSIYAALLALLYVGLALYVVKGRWKYLTARGDGGHHELQMRIRAHANLGEYAPIFLILLGLAELNGLSDTLIHICGAVFLMGRLLHPYSILCFEKYEGEKLVTTTRYRFYGMLMTLIPIAIVSVILIIQFILGLV